MNPNHEDETDDDDDEEARLLPNQTVYVHGRLLVVVAHAILWAHPVWVLVYLR